MNGYRVAGDYARLDKLIDTELRRGRMRTQRDVEQAKVAIKRLHDALLVAKAEHVQMAKLQLSQRRIRFQIVCDHLNHQALLWFAYISNEMST